jgi:hypothetical protein
MMTHLSDESQKQSRLEMIRQALKEKAPARYSELEASGNFLGFSDLDFDETTLPMG